MTEIFLVRHGETEWNRQRRLQGIQDIPLNESGKNQARELASVFAKIGIDAAASSDLGRARETARIIASASGVAEVIEYPGLRERDFGSASGMTYEEKAIAYPDNYIPDAESNDTLYERVATSLREIVRRYPDKTTVVVSHGGSINVLLLHLTGGTHGTGITILKNGSVSKLVYRDGAFAPVYINIEPARVLEQESANLDPV